MEMYTIVIPAYNQAEYLPEAIESALAQTIPCEVIVVNDGSPDNTSEIARKYPVKLIEQKNKGVSGARNTGIKHARGQWIVCLDSDDWIEPNYLEELSKLSGDIICPSVIEFGESRITYYPPNKNPTHQDFLRENQVVCASLFRKEMWERVRGYDETLKKGLEDWNFWIKGSYLGYKAVVSPKPLFHYRKKRESMFMEVKKDWENIKKDMFEKFEIWKKGVII